MPTSFGEAALVKIGGLYKHLYDEAVAEARLVDSRLSHADFTPDVDAAGRRMLNATSPTTKAAHRRVASFGAGEPQLVPVSRMPFGVFPDLAAVPFLSWTVPDTQDEYDECAWLVRVYADDRIEVGQTRAQMWVQSRLVGQGLVVGEIDADGDYVPLGFNPETGRWQPIGPDDTFEFAD